MGWHLVLLPDSIILQLPLFTSCAAGTSILTMVSLGALASTATGGRRVALVRGMTAWLRLALTTSALMLLVCTRRMARVTATTVSLSAALVLY